jgi:hypothetical protein
MVDLLVMSGQVTKAQERPLLSRFFKPFRAYKDMPAEGVDAPARAHEVPEDYKKSAEFAPGLPVKGTKRPIPRILRPEEWRLNEQSHDAATAGLHSDLRLSDGKTAFSWASRKGIPEPGGKVLVVRQSDHSPDYFGWSGIIADGYGRGKVKSVREGTAKIQSASGDKIKAVLLDSKNPQHLTFVRTPRYGPDHWLLINTTPTPESRPDIPLGKPTTKQIAGDLGRYMSDRYTLASKIDGAHTVVSFDDSVGVYSHQPSVDGTLIDHTFVTRADEIKVPESLKGTKLRAEVFGVKGNKTLTIGDLGGLLNAAPDKALKRMAEDGSQLYVAPFQVVTHKGESYVGRPYSEHLKALREITALLPRNWIMPDVATTKAQKEKMLEAIKTGKHPLTREGVVVWSSDGIAATPSKFKFVDHHQVFIDEIFPLVSRGEEKALAGGFTYSLKPEGPVVGRVGTGFTDELRKEMWKNRDVMKGRKVIINSVEQFKSGAFRAPSFEAFHL